MPTLEARSEVRDLCHRAVAETNPTHRADALAQIQDVIRSEYRFAQSAEDRLSLRIAGQIFDFIGETLNSRSGE